MTTQYDNASQHEQVEQQFSYHRPEFQETMDKMGQIREYCLQLGHAIVDNCPESRERSLALSKLDAVCMMAIAALARHEPKGERENITSHPK